MPLAHSQWFKKQSHYIRHACYFVIVDSDLSLNSIVFYIAFNKYCGPTMCQALSLGLGLSSNSLARTRYNLPVWMLLAYFSLPHPFLCHFLTSPHWPTLKMWCFFLFFYRSRKHPQTNQFLKQQPNLFFLRAGPLEMLILPPLSTCSSDH